MVNKGTITKIIDFSFVDGPGNRMAIFLQGCNFNCGYCHNPETINNCRNCGECVSVCRKSALSIKDRRVIFDREKCVDCDLCVSTCKHSSTPKTSVLTAEQVFKKINSTKAFIQGITVSGGECTLQWPFIKELFERVKAETNLTTFIDTNGDIGLEALDNLLQLTDGFMLDIKAVDENVHKLVTGKGNLNVLQNIQTIFEQGKLYELRYVIVPTVNDKNEDIALLGQLVKSLDVYQRLVLIPFRNFGVKGKFKDLDSPSEVLLEEIKLTLESMGLKNVVLKNF